MARTTNKQKTNVMHDNGWIKIHRKIMDWEWYTDSNTKSLFLHLLLRANHNTGQWKGVDLARGQLVTGRHKLAAETGLTERAVRTSLKRLKNAQQIAIKTTNKYSVITVINYNTYNAHSIGTNQQSDQQSDQQTTNKRPTNDQQTTTNKKDKNNKKNKNNEKYTMADALAAVSDIDWIDNDLWRDWLELRKTKRWPTTARTVKCNIKKLTELGRYNANDCILQTVTRAYRDFYPVREVNQHAPELGGRELPEE